MAKHDKKPALSFRCRKAVVVLAIKRSERIEWQQQVESARILERMAEQELVLGHERNAERLSCHAADLRDATSESDQV